MRKNIQVILLASLSLGAMAQSSVSTKLPLNLFAQASQIDSNELMHIYLKGDFPELESIVREKGGTVKRTVGNYMAVAIPFYKILELDQNESVEAIHFDFGKGMAMLNESLAQTRVNLVHDATAGLHSAYSGNGVIVGVIDAGLDFNHPDFLSADSSTRVLELWDQTMSFNAQRTPSYGYGQVYDSADINAGNCPHEDQPNQFGHGTNTTGIAVSNGNSDEQFTGVAPDADIIIVSSDFNSNTWTSTVADAVDYIFERAEFYGKPCVINASIGTYSGSHDGRDAATVDIASKITEDAGRAMVCAAGNSGELDPYHLGYTVSTDTNFTWFESKSNGTIYFEMFSDTGSFESVNFAIGVDKVTPNYSFLGNVSFGLIENRLYTLTTDTLWSNSGNNLARVQTWADSLNGTYRLQFYINQIDSLDYNYRLMMTGSGSFDLWSTSNQILGWNDMVADNLPTQGQFADIVNYRAPDKEQQIVSAWACSDKVITVANYTNRTTYTDVDENEVVFSSLTAGAIAASSSAGPSRTGLVKPEVAAPGELTLTAGAGFQLQALLANTSFRPRVAVGGLHHRAGGTSSASPVVAGIAALLFEACPNANWEDVKTAIANGTKGDQFTGSLPNNNWGYGKADAVNALRYNQPSPALISDSDEFCDGESVTLTVAESFDSYHWNSGDTGQSISVNQGNLYFAEVENTLGCKGYSDSLQLIKRPIPNKPVIAVGSELPACANQPVGLGIEEEYGAYVWSTNQFTDEIFVTEAGYYACEVSNIHGCRNMSDTVYIEFHELTLDPIIGLKANDEITVGTGDSNTSFEWFLNNELMEGESDSTLSITKTGVYSAVAIDSNGCRWPTESITINALGISLAESQRLFELYPNPFSNSLTIDNKALASYKWSVQSVSGKTLLTGTTDKAVISIKTEQFPAGAYIVSLSSTKGNLNRLLIKQ